MLVDDKYQLPKKVVHYSDGAEAKYSDSDEEGARAKLAVCFGLQCLPCRSLFLINSPNVIGL